MSSKPPLMWENRTELHQLLVAFYAPIISHANTDLHAGGVVDMADDLAKLVLTRLEAIQQQDDARAEEAEGK